MPAAYRHDSTGLKSRNLKSARVLYPAPSRIKDPAGELIGYKDTVIFPVEIEATDPTRPVRLALNVEFGVCREICILAQAKHTLTIRTTKAFAMPPALHRTLERIPRNLRQLRPSDPRLGTINANLAAGSRSITIETKYPANTKQKIDLFRRDRRWYLPSHGTAQESRRCKPGTL